MNQATINDFVRDNPNCKTLAATKGIIFIFERILSANKNLIKMVQFSELGSPALAACVAEINAYYNNNKNCGFSLEDNFTRQAIGKMVKTVLRPFGYTPFVSKSLPKNEYFTAAKNYKLTEKTHLWVECTIVEC